MAMEIKFTSNQNHISSDDPDFYFMEREEITYDFEIKGENGLYTLQITSRTATTDPNRQFLTKPYALKEAATPGNIIAFWIYDGDTNIGKLYFNYYHDTEYKTFFVAIETNIFHNIKGMVLIVFKRLQNFKLIP